MKRRLSIPIKHWWLIIGILIGFGLIRVPVEKKLRKDLTEAQMLLPPIGPTAISKMRHSALMGTLGGLRTLVATGYLLESFNHFETDSWDENRKALVMATYLEPTDESHWISLVWNRGINAPAWLETRAQLPDYERRLRHKEYTLDAVELGKEGLEHLPESIDLRQQIAQVYKVKIKDMCGAAEMYKQMIGLKGAPMYAERFYAYHLSECRGHEREAYEILLSLYHEGERNHLPTLIKKILVLQEYLNIPTPMWIAEQDPDAEEEAKVKSGKRRPPASVQLPGGVKIR